MSSTHHRPPQTASSLTSLLLSDYRAHYTSREESDLRSALLFVPRYCTNVSLHATMLIRLMTRCPPWASWLFRNLLVAKHGCDVHRDVTVGPGLLLHHPTGIVIESGVVIGRGVTIFHNVTLAAQYRRAPDELARGRLTPLIDDGACIFTGSVLVGGIAVGAAAVIGAHSYVDRDVPPNGVVTSGTRF